MNTTQFKNGLAWVSAKATAGYEGCHWMLSAGSSYMIYSIILNNGLQAGYSIWLLAPIALIAGAVWYGAIEHTLKVILPFAIGFLFSSKADKKALTPEDRRAGWMAVVASTALLIATGSLSFFINPHISDAVNTLEDSSVEIAQNESVRSSYDKDVAIYEGQLADAKESDAKAIEVAEAEAARWVKAAQDVRGVTLGNLLRKNHGWAFTQLTSSQKQKIKTETSRGERHVQKARDNAASPTLQGKLTAYMERSGGARDSVAIATLGIITKREKKYDAKVSGMNRTLFYGVAFTLVLFVFLCCLMVNARMSRGEDIVDDDSPGIFKVAKSAVGAMNKRLGAKYADKWNVKFVSAAPSLALATDYSASIKSASVNAENSLTSGFQHIKSEPEAPEVSESQEEVSEIVSAPPPAGFAVPKKVSAGFWIDDAVKYRKRVYGWWTTAHNTKKGKDTREDNRKKAEDAFTWFESQGCTVTKKGPGKVSIKFPKS